MIFRYVIYFVKETKHITSLLKIYLHVILNKNKIQ